MGALSSYLHTAHDTYRNEPEHDQNQANTDSTGLIFSSFGIFIQCS